ncbi:MAG: FHA domain-containing protein [Pseudomonadota bacterium]
MLSILYPVPGGIGRTRIVPGRPVVLGKEPAAKDGSSTVLIKLSDILVSKSHAEFVYYDDNSCEVRDLGSTNGVVFEGARLDRAYVTAGDVLVLGGSSIFIVEDGLADRLSPWVEQCQCARDGLSDSSEPQFFLLGPAFERPQKAALFRLDESRRVRVSRGKEAGENSSSFTINDRSVGNPHCEFVLKNGVMTLTNLDRKRGTFVNGESIDELVCSPGASIAIGRVHLHIASKSAVQAIFDLYNLLMARSRTAEQFYLVLVLLRSSSPFSGTFTHALDMLGDPGSSGLHAPLSGDLHLAAFCSTEIDRAMRLARSTLSWRQQHFAGATLFAADLVVFSEFPAGGNTITSSIGGYDEPTDVSMTGMALAPEARITIFPERFGYQGVLTQKDLGGKPIIPWFNKNRVTLEIPRHPFFQHCHGMCLNEWEQSLSPVFKGILDRLERSGGKTANLVSEGLILLEDIVSLMSLTALETSYGTKAHRPELKSLLEKGTLGAMNELLQRLSSDIPEAILPRYLKPVRSDRTLRDGLNTIVALRNRIMHGGLVPGEDDLRILSGLIVKLVQAFSSGKPWVQNWALWSIQNTGRRPVVCGATEAVYESNLLVNSSCPRCDDARRHGRLRRATSKGWEVAFSFCGHSIYLNEFESPWLEHSKTSELNLLFCKVCGLPLDAKDAPCGNCAPTRRG